MALSASVTRRLAAPLLSPQLYMFVRKLRSDAALEAIRRASENKTPNLVLYNYPSFSGAYGALFAHLYHTRLNLPCLILPFSSVAPFSVEDLCFDGMTTCYFLDFIGPKGFALELSMRTSSKVIGFDHRKSVLPRLSSREVSDTNLTFHVNVEKSSSTAAYEYFSAQVLESRCDDDDTMSLLNHEDQERVEMILKYIEDGDLRKYNLPDIKAFNIGLREWRAKFNCITNSCMYQQLMEICSLDLITKGNKYLSYRDTDANKLVHKVFRVRLGRGFYGECLGVRADATPDLSDEIGKELSQRSAAAGLRSQPFPEVPSALGLEITEYIPASISSIEAVSRPIGAVIYMQRNNLKMCLRTTDSSTDTSEVAKAYGGGGSPSSSSFIIRMDEYNEWLSMQSSPKC